MLSALAPRSLALATPMFPAGLGAAANTPFVALDLNVQPKKPVSAAGGIGSHSSSATPAAFDLSSVLESDSDTFEFVGGFAIDGTPPPFPLVNTAPLFADYPMPSFLPFAFPLPAQTHFPSFPLPSLPPLPPSLPCLSGPSGQPPAPAPTPGVPRLRPAPPVPRTASRVPQNSLPFFAQSPLPSRSLLPSYCPPPLVPPHLVVPSSPPPAHSSPARSPSSPSSVFSSSSSCSDSDTEEDEKSPVSPVTSRKKSKIVRAAIKKAAPTSFTSVECVACVFIKATDDPDLVVENAVSEDLLCSHHGAQSQLDVDVPVLYCSPVAIGAGGEKKKKPANMPKHKCSLWRTTKTVPVSFKSFSVPGCAPRQFHVLSRPLRDDERLPHGWIKVDVDNIRLRLLRKNHRLVPVKRCKQALKAFVQRRFPSEAQAEEENDQ